MRPLLPLGLLAPVALAAGATAPPDIAFRNVTAGSGLEALRAVYGVPAGKRTILENIGGGVAFVDLDGDGLLDVYLPSGQPSYEARTAANALLRGHGDGRFTAAPGVSGALLRGWFFGVAAADYDDDGFRDLYVTELGRNALLRNNGDGSFSDVTDDAGATFDGFSTGAAWADLDRDGWLDLAAANYVAIDVATIPAPGSGPHCRWKGLAVPCGPRGLGGERAVVLRGDGRAGFERIQEETFVAADSYGLGVTWADHDGDGWIDLYIADDQTPNRLYVNHAGVLVESGLLSGTAFSEDGHAEAGMGVDWADVNGDAVADLFVTNFADESNTLYLALRGGLFRDATTSLGLALPSFRQVGWGTGFRDFDADGRLDLFIANGHVYSQVDEYELSDEYPQADQMFRNLGERFEPWVPAAGDALGEPAVSRGAAFGDYDGDGRVDVLVATLDGAPRLLHNELPAGNALEVRLGRRAGNRGAVGARVLVEATGFPAQAREVQAGHSYLSQSDYTLHFGLAGATEATVTVYWPAGPPGASTRVAGVPANHLLTIVEGQGHDTRPLRARARQP